MREKLSGQEYGSLLMVPQEEATANSVPAAAVIQRWQRCSDLLGVKRARRYRVSDVKSHCSAAELHSKLRNLSTGEESGILGVAVKCVDIKKNTSGEGGSLECY